MKRILIGFISLLMLLPAAALGQVVTMDEGHAAFDYPDSWLVVSPQLCGVYAPLLESAGLDADALAAEMEQTRTLSRAYSADFAQNMSVIIKEDDTSADIYEIDAITDAQRATLRRRAESNSLWETTGLRAQDVEWQKEGGSYWLYIHYTITRSDEIVGRGLRYITIHNGMYIMLDWRIQGRRFTARDLSAFRARLADLTITESIEEPTRTVSLDAVIPAETTTANVEITGTATAGATIIAETTDGFGASNTLAVAQAGSNGRFTLTVELEKEGECAVTLTASKDGMDSVTAEGTIAYSAKTLPLSGVPESQSVTTDTVTISGTTLAGVQMQLVTPFGVTKKRSGNDGSFSFELTTKDAGDYNYTLILDKSGYNQRRVPFTITREVTDDQERDKIRQTAVKISYQNLQKERAADQGQVMRLYGPVTELSSSGNNYYIRMSYNKDANGKWYNDVIIIATEDTGVKEGDMLTAVVTVDGVYQEQDAGGNEVIIPRFELLFVDKIE